MVIAERTTTHGPAVVETLLPGAPLARVLTRERHASLAIDAADWLADLALDRPFEERDAWWPVTAAPIVERFEALVSPTVAADHLAACRERLEVLDRLPSVIEHRDFAPWNLLVDEDGTLRAVDWESSVRCGLPLLDLWYFLTYLALAVERLPERRLADAYPQLVDLARVRGEYRPRPSTTISSGSASIRGGLCATGAHLDGPHALRARTSAARRGPRQHDFRPAVGPRDVDLMHILVITDGFPYPLTSGRLRQFHLLKLLGRSHRITLVSAVPPDHPAEHAAALADDLERIETVHWRRLRRGVRAKTWSRIQPEGTPDRSTDRHSPRPGPIRCGPQCPVAIAAS